MYSAIDEQDLRFHYIHTKDDSPIGYQKICKAEDKPVPDDEIVKAYEFEKGEYVYMTDEDFAAAESEGYKTIEITDFVPYDDIDPIYFEKTYFLGPQDGAERVYNLLLRAMEDSGLAAIAKYIMREKQHLGCLRVREGVITLEKMYFADEIRPIDEIKPKAEKVGKQELEMAAQLIDRFTGDFKPEQYEDTYREALFDVIKQKRKGKEIHVAPPLEDEGPPDIMAALRESLERSRRGRPGRRAAASANGDLEELSKSELEERAKEAGIPGRSKMSKKQLVKALADAA
jgi:DNA end-binding protein Ku